MSFVELQAMRMSKVNQELKWSHQIFSYILQNFETWFGPDVNLDWFTMMWLLMSWVYYRVYCWISLSLGTTKGKKNEASSSCAISVILKMCMGLLGNSRNQTKYNNLWKQKQDLKSFKFFSSADTHALSSLKMSKNHWLFWRAKRL